MRATIVKPNSPLDQIRHQQPRAQARAHQALSPAEQADLQAILTEPMDFVENDLYPQADAEQIIFDDALELPEPNTSWYHPVMDTETAPTKQSQIVNVVLNKEQEKTLFLQFNYARYRVAQLQEGLTDSSIHEEKAREAIRWYRRSQQLRDRIAEFNLALVLAMSKRVRAKDVEFGDLIAEGNMALLRSIDKFNIAYGFKFSTYACRAILKSFSRIGVKSTKYRNMFPTDFDPKLERSQWQDTQNEDLASDYANQVRRIVKENHADLSDMETAVIEHRFALDLASDTPPLTLEQVGRIVGLTKERVRQIQNKALAKIKSTLETEFIDGRRLEWETLAATTTN